MVGSQMPLRLCYRTTVFRYEPEHAGREREIFQVGAELIGTDTVAADAEMIALMGDCLQQLGLHDFKISLGHVGFFKALLAKSGLSVEGQKRAEQAAARKDLPRLEEIFQEEQVATAQARAILETPGLYGKEEVLARGRVLAGRDPALRAALDRLTQVYELLSASDLKDRLLLDLGEFRDFEYYDGLVFEVFAKGLGYEIGGGGRYNHLIGRFGRDLPSTGFAFDVDRLFQSMESVDGEPVRSGVHCLICSVSDQQAQAFEVARGLRQGGYRVVLGRSMGNSPQAVRLMLEEGKRLDAQVTALIGSAGVASDEVLVVSVSPKVQQRTVKIKELPSLLRL
jgi:ATP phosphoribosyltransferase regulatory subunit